LSSAVVKTSFFFGRDRRVPRNQHGHHTALGFQAEGERSDVQQEDLLDIPGQDRALDGRAHGDDLVGVDPLVWVLTEDFLDDLLDAGHASRAADQDHLVDLSGFELGVLEGLEDRAAAAFEKAVGQLLELGAGDGHGHVLGARGIGRDERQVNVGLSLEREVLLGLLGGLLEPLQGHLILA